MNQASSKERRYFEMFRKDYPLRAGSIEYGDKPDVILHGEKVTGIEITNFFIEPGYSLHSEQRQRLKRTAVISSAQRLFQAETGKKFEFTFHFNNEKPIKNVNGLALKIADLAKKLAGRKTGQIPRTLFEQIPEISTIYLNAKEYDDAKWRLAQLFSVPFISRERLEAIIVEKERKSKEYRKCDAFWLLVIIDFMDRAQDQEITIDRIVGIKSKVFEKIIAYKTVFGDFIETSAIDNICNR